jgi:HEAT repeat protein
MLDTESDLEVRLAAIGSLSSFNEYPEVVEKLISLLVDANDQVLIEVISSLGYLGDKRALAPIKEVRQRTSNSRVQEFAKAAIKRLNS